MITRDDELYSVNFSTRGRPAGQAPSARPHDQARAPTTSACDETPETNDQPNIRVENVFWTIVFVGLSAGLFGCFCTF
ncbi:hypothetical protein RISK_005268 [Rhodopirellula islandica]|uniref:Transmembrane protein n=1 Tax=Rhodopirellula islandica TaxID=595434 RepID=A0A0J1B633_RHOIS|nr:hypothetical protein RISK_005268 [Rhodopirellula islandica]